MPEETEQPDFPPRAQFIDPAEGILADQRGKYIAHLSLDLMESIDLFGELRAFRRQAELLRGTLLRVELENKFDTRPVHSMARQLKDMLEQAERLQRKVEGAIYEPFHNLALFTSGIRRDP